MGKQAHIVAVLGESLDARGWGISPSPRHIADIFEQAEVWIGPRPMLEQDERFMQPIPYVVVERDGEILTYVRQTSGGEDRLHDKVSIGFGGHVDLADAVVDDRGVIDLYATMIAATKRELAEELGVELTQEQLQEATKFTHVISSDANAVDRVHMGFVAKVNLDTIGFTDEIGDADFRSIEDLRRVTDRLENWSKLVVQSI